MKRHWITTFVTLLTLTLLTATLVAAEKRDRPRPDGAKRGGRRPGGDRKLPDIGLTEAQKTEIEAIRKAAMAKIKDADPKERRAIYMKMRGDIQAKFTKDQLAKLKAARQRGGSDRPDLKLTEEQKKKMAAIRKAAGAKLKDAKPEQRRAIMEEMRKQSEAILTPEQLKKLKEARQGQHRRGMPDIGLTDEQKTKIQAIRKRAMEASKGKKGEERKAIMEKMQKAIHALLTDEQAEKLKKARQNQPRRGGKPEGRGRGDRKGPRGGSGGRKRPEGK
jgi:Spy/CpxP family protein refolding chaperone